MLMRICTLYIMYNKYGNICVCLRHHIIYAHQHNGYVESLVYVRAERMYLCVQYVRLLLLQYVRLEIGVPHELGHIAPVN